VGGPNGSQQSTFLGAPPGKKRATRSTAGGSPVKLTNFEMRSYNQNRSGDEEDGSRTTDVTGGRGKSRPVQKAQDSIFGVVIKGQTARLEELKDMDEQIL